MNFEGLKNLVLKQLKVKSRNQKTWRRSLKNHPCKKCGKLTPTKQSYHVLCSECTQDYLNSLEEIARLEKEKHEKLKKRNDIKKREYNRVYGQIRKVKERMIDIPRELQDVPYDRSCLKCDRDFVAVGKYNRICPSCTNVNLDIATQW
tara:strand:- start:66 stop:509 length:444 start_codon:yes stop_codon:yes gene_type:complete